MFAIKRPCVIYTTCRRANDVENLFSFTRRGGDESH